MSVKEWVQRKMVIVYCINLDRRPDRMDRMIKLSSIANVNLIRVAAVDAYDESNFNEINELPFRGPTGDVGVGTRACTLSHGRAWAKFLESKEEVAVFLEDDVILSADFGMILEILTQANLFGFDLLKIECGGAMRGGAFVGKPQDIANGRVVRESYQLLTDAAGYILTRRGAMKMLDALPHISAGVDHALFYPIERRGFPAIKYGVVDPAIVIQDRGLNSDIAKTRYTNAKWKRDIKRAFYEAAQAPRVLLSMVWRGVRLRKMDFRK